jgi:NADH-quinone oxidoreductase subunit J
MLTAFYIAGLITLISALLVITRTEAVHALLYLVVSMLSLAIIFFLVGAPFAAALEVIVYAGAIMVLFIFVVMLLNLGKQAQKAEKALLRPRIWIGPSLLSLILAVELTLVVFSGESHLLSDRPVSAGQVGASLFGPYVLAVELVAFLLLAGLVGAHHLGQKDKKIYHRFLSGEAK